MILNYIKLSLRLLTRNPFITAINILGLSIGFAAFFILWPYAYSELTSDRFHKDYDRIARLTWHHRYTDHGQDWHEFLNGINFTGVAKHVADEFKEVEDLTRYVPQREFLRPLHGTGIDAFITVYERDSTKHNFRQENAAFADPNFFQFFSFPLIKGDAAAVLAQPRTVVLSKANSIKLFGTTDPIDAVVYLSDSIPLKVTGVLDDLPRNTYFKFDMVISMAGFDEADERFGGFDGRIKRFAWMGECFVRMREGVTLTSLQKKIDDKRKVFYANVEGGDPTIYLEALKNIPFSTTGRTQSYRSRSAIIILATLSVVILFLAWTNYVSLSISTLHRRMAEVGTRKVVGARKKDFVIQFFVESTIINLLALVLSLTLVQLVKGPAEYLFNFYLVDSKIILEEHLPLFLALPLIGIVLTSLYPVLISSRKGAVLLLKRLPGMETPWWIRLLLTFQYSSAVVLLIWVVAVYFQLNYIMNKSTGVNEVGVIVADCPLNKRQDYNSKLEYFVNESTRIEGVQKASLSKATMGDQGGLPQFVQQVDGIPAVGFWSSGGVDEKFLDLYGIRLLEGRNFSSDGPSNHKSILVSDVATERLGFSSPAEAIGARVILNYTNRDMEIIGVYREYEYAPFFASLQTSPGTLLTYKNAVAQDQPISKISFRINLQQTTGNISKLDELYQTVFPQEAFRWIFLDQNIRRNYAQEQITRNQIILFTFLAIGIACLGLLGTTSNKVVEKTKEIGIRKVLGARMHQLALVVVNTTLKQVVIAIIVGVPLAYFLVEKYQERYSERMTLAWWHYALPIGLLLIVMVVTIAGVLLRAAKTNPVESLRSE
jgi:putative ABC transport system permease protein